VTAVLGPVASVALAALIAVAAYVASVPLLAAAVGLGVLALALGWSSLMELPSRRGTTLAVLGIGWVAAAMAVRAMDMTRPLAPFAALLAVAVLVAFAHELIRRHGRPHLVESLTGTLSGEAVALLGGGWVLLPSTRLRLAAVVAVAAAAAGARLTAAFPVPARWSGWAAAGVGTVVGTVAGVVTDPSRVVPVVVVSVVVAGVVSGLDRLFLGMTGVRSVPALLSSSAAPVLAVGTVAYAVARFMA
jgi:hypothetical protein